MVRSSKPWRPANKVLVQAMLMLAGGGEACSDIERLRSQPSLFGMVPSDSTLYRTIRSIDAAVLGGVWEAMAETRAQVWRRSSATTDDEVFKHDVHVEDDGRCLCGAGREFDAGRSQDELRERERGPVAVVESAEVHVRQLARVVSDISDEFEFGAEGVELAARSLGANG
jgi:hypothetical protein